MCNSPHYVLRVPSALYDRLKMYAETFKRDPTDEAQAALRLWCLVRQGEVVVTTTDGSPVDLDG